MTEEDWTNPEHPPRLGDVASIDLGGGVWVVWLEDRPNSPYLWHWCVRSEGTGGATPGWTLGGTALHTVVTRNPLTLFPSVYWRDCCGKHGFVENGHWRSV